MTENGVRMAPQDPPRHRGRNPAAAFKAGCARLWGMPVFDRFDDQGSRRALVIFVLTLLAVIPMLAAVFDSNLPLAVLGPIAAATIFVLGGSIDAITDRPTASLDERERSIRDSTLARPLEVGVVLGIGVGVLLVEAFRSDTAWAMAAVTVLAAFAFLVRALLIAWRLPSHDDGD